MIPENPKDLVPQFFDNTSDSYDKIVHWTTFGKDSLWKNKILEQLSSEKKVLDLACGTGILTRQIAQKIPQAEIVGVDMTSTYLDKAKEKSSSNHNILFVNQDAEKLNLGRRFDCITASYLPKYCDPDILIKTCLEHLNDDGKIILHDFTYPKNKFVRKMWNVYFKVLCFVGFFIPSWKNVFVDLPQLIRTSNWVSEYKKTMKNAGLKIHLEELTWGSSAVLVGTRVP